jgi:hypothetical protein
VDRLGAVGCRRGLGTERGGLHVGTIAGRAGRPVARLDGPRGPRRG